jgi:hypothetical protein
LNVAASKSHIDRLSPNRPELASNDVRPSNPVKLFVPPGHFYSPIVDPDEAAKYLTLARSVSAESVSGIVINRNEMVKAWYDLIPFFTTSPFSANQTPPLRYHFENPFYSWGDGSMLHAMLRHFCPRRVVEIGCGWSSACMLDTIGKYLGGNCRVTFIEPFPQRLRELIPNLPANSKIIESRVQDASLGIFEELSSGDILFIDSTHVLRTGSDVCFELFDILPRLTKGVLVHIHDMFWPFEYPVSWIIDDNRSWNELYAVRAFLTHNNAWRIVMFNDYLAQVERPMIERTFPLFLRNSGGALWLQRQ